MPNDDYPVSVYQAANSVEAYLIHNVLVDEGIECQVAEGSAYVGMAFAPCHVLVRSSDKQRAREIIERLEHQRAENSDQPDDSETDE